MFKKSSNYFTRQITASIGISAAVIFGVTLVIIANLTPEFQFLEDYLSKLGATGQLYAIWWNLIGFLLVGILLAAFGYSYGRVVNDRLVGICLALFGVGFAATALPIDLTNSESALSKTHVVAICLGLAGWMFGLARMVQIKTLGKSVRYSANIAAALVVLPMFGFVTGIWSMPITHRLIFAVVFGWVLITSIRLLSDSGSSRNFDESTVHSKR